MESKFFSCVEKESFILRDLLHNLAKTDPTYNGYYTSVPSVLFSIYNDLLIKETGLSYLNYSESERKYYFNIIEDHKYMLARIKYGI